MCQTQWIFFVGYYKWPFVRHKIVMTTYGYFNKRNQSWNGTFSIGKFSVFHFQKQPRNKKNSRKKAIDYRRGRKKDKQLKKEKQMKKNKKVKCRQGKLHIQRRNSISYIHNHVMVFDWNMVRLWFVSYRSKSVRNRSNEAQNNTNSTTTTSNNNNKGNAKTESGTPTFRWFDVYVIVPLCFVDFFF